MAHVSATTARHSSGKFSAKDNFDEPVVVEWHMARGKEQSYRDNMKQVIDVTCTAFTDVEVDFLREYPDVVGKDEFYKPFEQLFVGGIDKVNWDAVAKKMQESIKATLLTDISTTDPDGMYFFVTVKKATTQNVLGAAIFLVTVGYPYGSVKVMSIGVQPEAQGRGLGKLLMSSIFKIVPDCTRIFLATRITNHGAQRAYFSWGFTREEIPSQDEHYTLSEKHWIFLEYVTSRSGKLQKVAESLQRMK